MIIIDKDKVQSVAWKDDPATYDQRLHQLGQGFDEFIIVNPIFDDWILDYVNTDLSADHCIMWTKKDKWIAKKFKGTWTPADGWRVIECDFKVAKVNEFDLAEEFNPDIPANLFKPITQSIEPEDYNLEHVWYLDPKYFPGDKIWVKKIRACEHPMGIKDMGYVTPEILDELDVVFISYDESNADANWNKVLNRVPFAQRVHGVNGIFEAHKAAAELAQTDMFWVVDGDADLLDDWHFNYQPNIFNRECVHVWPSRNAVNGLEYGYGGVKLFPRKLLLDAQTWNVDLTTGLGTKLKVMKRVSNITAFNTDPFSTWRSAFRECAKLAAGTIKNQIDDETTLRLDTWCSVASGDFGEFAILGATAGKQYGEEHRSNSSALRLINNRTWLKEKFNEQI
jgi:hypothetical protein